MKIWFAFFMYSVMSHASVDQVISLGVFGNETVNEGPCFVFQWFLYQTEKLSCVNCELSLPCANKIICFTACKILLWCSLEWTAAQFVQFCSCSHGLGRCIVFRRTAELQLVSYNSIKNPLCPKIRKNVSSSSFLALWINLAKMHYNTVIQVNSLLKKDSKQICWVGCWHILSFWSCQAALMLTLKPTAIAE